MPNSVHANPLHSIPSHPTWNEAFFRSILDHADMAVFVMNRVYEVVYANQHFSNLVNVPREMLIGMELPRHKTLPDEDAQRVIEHMLRVFDQGVSERIENWALRPDGSRFLMLWSSTPLFDADGKTQFLLSVGMDVTEQHTTRKRLEGMAHRDPLTGLHNRTFFDQRIAEDLERVTSGDDTGLALFFIDLDKFKPINDEFGHDVGDAILCETARRLRKRVRKNDTVCRIGGDEFVVILPNMTSQGILQDLASEMLEELAIPFHVTKCDCMMSASIGIALAPQHGSNPQDLVKAADAAMYLAKRSGKNSFCFAET